MTKRGYPCPDVPDGVCRCRCHAIGMARSAQKNTRRDAWKDSHDILLKAMLGDGHTPDRIADTLSERFKIPRTTLAVRRRIKQLDISTRDGWRSREDVIKLLGTSWRNMARWEAEGLLSGAEYGRWRRYRLSDVEAFVKVHAGMLVDPRRVKDARLRSLAETAAIVNRRRSQVAS